MSGYMGASASGKKCSCKNHKWKVVAIRTVKLGRHFGKDVTTILCYNCKNQWETMANYAKNIRKEEYNENR